MTPRPGDVINTTGHAQPAAFEALPRGAEWAMEFEDVRG